MDGMIAFLTARLNDGSRAARAVRIPDGVYDLSREQVFAMHILAEGRAQEARIGQYLAAAAEAERFPHGANVMVRDALFDALRHDAAAFSHHQDYDPEWAPPAPAASEDGEART